MVGIGIVVFNGRISVNGGTCLFCIRSSSSCQNMPYSLVGSFCRFPSAKALVEHHPLVESLLLAGSLFCKAAVLASTSSFCSL